MHWTLTIMVVWISRVSIYCGLMFTHFRLIIAGTYTFGWFGPGKPPSKYAHNQAKVMRWPWWELRPTFLGSFNQYIKNRSTCGLL